MRIKRGGINWEANHSRYKRILQSHARDDGRAENTDEKLEDEDDTVGSVDVVGRRGATSTETVDCSPYDMLA